MDIKFRAWDKARGEIGQVVVIDFLNKIIWIKYDRNKMINADFYEVELMQYTSVKDLNEREIYEGDIVKFTSVYTTSKYDYGEVIFREGSFKVIIPGVKGKDWFNTINNFTVKHGKLEVIGNIHEDENLRVRDYYV